MFTLVCQSYLILSVYMCGGNECGNSRETSTGTIIGEKEMLGKWGRAKESTWNERGNWIFRDAWMKRRFGDGRGDEEGESIKTNTNAMSANFNNKWINIKSSTFKIFSYKSYLISNFCKSKWSILHGASAPLKRWRGFQSKEIFN